MITRSQQKIINELKDAFSNASSFETVDQTSINGKVLVFCSVVPYSCKGDYLRNQFEVGPRGGLKTVKQEFDASY